MFRILFGAFSLLFLIYLVFPGPSSIDDFPALPNSVKSTHSGDTWQMPNIAAYYSNNYRNFVTDYYKSYYQGLMKFPLPPIKLNYPPEYAFTAILDQTKSTYLEEYVYPLRESLYVNGMEPYYEDGMSKYEGATPFVEEGQNWQTKTTLRYYPSPMWVRLVTWFGLNIAIVLLWKLTRRILHG